MDGNKSQLISDEEIIEGLRQRDSRITRDFFYGYCRIAYHIYKRRYDLEYRQGLDFYSIAHEYYLSLDKHDFKQLEGRKPTMSLKTWMINGFRFVMLDRMKAYNKKILADSLEERVQKSDLRFDIVDADFNKEVRKTVDEICNSVLQRDSTDSLILQMLLIDGFKGKEAAKQLGISPSAVTQRYHKLMDNVVVPYFKHYFAMPILSQAREPRFEIQSSVSESRSEPFSSILHKEEQPEHKNYLERITPEFVDHLQKKQIFVFGSNLAGMHGGGAAGVARLHFGAKIGVGDGPQGRSYAIPTMLGDTSAIRPYVNQFISYAIQHPEETFLVTPIGCGIAGFYPSDIAPLFRDATKVDNIHLPKSFWDVLNVDF